MKVNLISNETGKSHPHYQPMPDVYIPISETDDTESIEFKKRVYSWMYKFFTPEIALNYAKKVGLKIVMIQKK